MLFISLVNSAKIAFFPWFSVPELLILKNTCWCTGYNLSGAEATFIMGFWFKLLWNARQRLVRFIHIDPMRLIQALWHQSVYQNQSVANLSQPIHLPTSKLTTYSLYKLATGQFKSRLPNRTIMYSITLNTQWVHDLLSCYTFLDICAWNPNYHYHCYLTDNRFWLDVVDSSASPLLLLCCCLSAAASSSLPWLFLTIMALLLQRK